MPLGEVNFACLSLIWTFNWIKDQVGYIILMSTSKVKSGGYSVVDGGSGEGAHPTRNQEEYVTSLSVQQIHGMLIIFVELGTFISLYHLRRISVLKQELGYFSEQWGRAHYNINR